VERPGILIVEDEFLLALDTKVLLEDAGLNVDGITLTGEEALDLLEKKLSGMVLMDIKLDGSLDGIETSRQIADRFGIPVVFVTGNVDTKTMDLAMATNPAGFLHKPLVEKDLLEMLDRVLDGTTQDKKTSNSS
jgi:DNA-binding NarL/FixJ family response regulator